MRYINVYNKSWQCGEPNKRSENCTAPVCASFERSQSGRVYIYRLQMGCGKPTKSELENHHLKNGKSTISMGHFNNSYVTKYQRVLDYICHTNSKSNVCFIVRRIVVYCFVFLMNREWLDVPWFLAQRFRWLVHVSSQCGQSYHVTAQFADSWMLAQRSFSYFSLCAIHHFMFEPRWPTMWGPPR